MKRFLVLLIVLVAITAVVGFNRGWFTVSQESDDGKEHVTGTVDRDKIEADKKRAADELRRLGEHKNGSQSDSTKE